MRPVFFCGINNAFILDIFIFPLCVLASWIVISAYLKRNGGRKHV